MPILMYRQIPVGDEPRIKARYVLEFPTESGIEQYYVQLKSKPSIVLDNNASFMTGNIKWNPIEITYIDLIGPTGSTKLLEWINFFEKENYDNFAYARAFKKDIVLNWVDPTGFIVEKWTLVKSFLDKREGLITSLEDLEFKLHFDKAFLSYD